MQCIIDGVIIRDLQQYNDNRGWLIELFRHDELSSDIFPVMGYISMTHPGIVRGPHEHKEQTDIFCLIGPSTFRLYLWDNRPKSPTYQATCQVELGEKHKAMVIIPPGVVHAYKNIGDTDGIVFNVPNRLYAGEGKQFPVDEIRHEDNPDSPFRIED